MFNLSTSRIFDANNISEISYARLSAFDALRLALK